MSTVLIFDIRSVILGGQRYVYCATGEHWVAHGGGAYFRDTQLRVLCTTCRDRAMTRTPHEEQLSKQYQREHEQLHRAATLLREALPILVGDLPPSPDHHCGVDGMCDMDCASWAFAANRIRSIGSLLAELETPGNG